MKVLVVDDSQPRVEIIREALSRSSVAHLCTVNYCDSADAARLAMRDTVDLLVLDVRIPKKRNGVAQAIHSVRLLADICDPTKSYVRPRLIIGLTADLDELGSYREEFANYATVVLEGTVAGRDWLTKILAHVQSLVSDEQKFSKKDKKITLLTVHGIRTHGAWQEKVAERAALYSDDVNSIEVKYGFFDLISFILPPLRRRRIAKSATRLSRLIKESDGRDIYLVAHSFGTMIVAEALKDMRLSKKIKWIVFCGSPLPCDCDIDHVVSAAEVTVNDCGTRDLVLVAARVFVLGLGDAGRIGFQREQSTSFVNRFFPGGHSLFFDVTAESTFADDYWLKPMFSGKPIGRSDCRTHFMFEGVLDVAIKVFSLVKGVWYGLGGALAAWGVWSLIASLARLTN